MTDENTLKLDELTPEDWDELRSIMNILKPFKDWSVKLQGKCKNGSLYEIFPAMDMLLSHLEWAKTDYTIPGLHSEHLQGSINTAWAKLNQFVPLPCLIPKL